jgi:C_GCAxxG_C_C family probable redox protein
MRGECWLKTEDFVQTRVARYYWRDDINCATTTLKILSEHFDFALSEQVIDGAVGMHGAGEYGAQCGLVEGALMFLGIMGRSRAIPDNDIISACRAFAEGFEKRFKSLSCAILRPAGFDPRNPPHLCEDFTCRAVGFSIGFIQEFFAASQSRPGTG